LGQNILILPLYIGKIDRHGSITRPHDHRYIAVPENSTSPVYYRRRKASRVSEVEILFVLPSRARKRVVLFPFSVDHYCTCHIKRCARVCAHKKCAIICLLMNNKALVWVYVLSTGPRFWAWLSHQMWILTEKEISKNCTPQNCQNYTLQVDAKISRNDICRCIDRTLEIVSLVRSGIHLASYGTSIAEDNRKENKYQDGKYA
jgi:hypothetical protein